MSSSRRRSTARPKQIRGEALAGRVLELDIGPVAHGGSCVARHDGRVVFVRHTLPGERVRAVVTEGGSDDPFLRADAVEVLAPGADRVEPVCRHAGPGGCGGCDWQHVSLAGQRRLKGHVVSEQLRRLAGIEREVEVAPVPGDDAGLAWRTRVEFAVGPDGRAGLRPHRSHAVMPLQQCPITDPRVLATGVLDRAWPGRRAVEVVAPSIGRPVVVPVGGRPRAGTPQRPRPAPGEIRERVAGARWTGEFALQARGFWQVHPGAAALFVDRVLELLAPRPGERVLDLYAGVGLFAVPLADAVGPSGSVLAVESDPLAAAHARANADGGGVARPWVQVRADRVEHVLAEPAAAGAVDADLVVLDPPRTGAGRAVVERICALGPRAVCYVACDPAALARDLAYAAAAGYRLTALEAYDAFPMTHHVECLALLEPGPLPAAAPQDRPDETVGESRLGSGTFVG